MEKTLLEKTANKLVNAFNNNNIIAPIPSKFTKKLRE
jgi:2-keto-4-pentenoate hydratase